MLRRKHGENHGQAVRKVADAAALLTMRMRFPKCSSTKSCMTISSALPAPHVSINRSGRAQAPAVQWRQWRLRQACSWMDGRDYVVPEDVRAIYPDCTAHRLLLTAQAKAQGEQPRELLDEILRKTPAPKIR